MMKKTSFLAQHIKYLLILSALTAVAMFMSQLAFDSFGPFMSQTAHMIPYLFALLFMMTAADHSCLRTGTTVQNLLKRVLYAPLVLAEVWGLLYVARYLNALWLPTPFRIPVDLSQMLPLLCAYLAGGLLFFWGNRYGAPQMSELLLLPIMPILLFTLIVLVVPCLPNWGGPVSFDLGSRTVFCGFYLVLAIFFAAAHLLSFLLAPTHKPRSFPPDERTALLGLNRSELRCLILAFLLAYPVQLMIDVVSDHYNPVRLIYPSTGWAALLLIAFFVLLVTLSRRYDDLLLLNVSRKRALSLVGRIAIPCAVLLTAAATALRAMEHVFLTPLYLFFGAPETLSSEVFWWVPTLMPTLLLLGFLLFKALRTLPASNARSKKQGRLFLGLFALSLCFFPVSFFLSGGVSFSPGSVLPGLFLPMALAAFWSVKQLLHAPAL